MRSYVREGPLASRRTPLPVRHYGSGIAGVVVAARDRRVILAREQPSALQHRAVRHDVRLSEVDVASDDTHPPEPVRSRDASDPEVVEMLAAHPADDRCVE